MAHYVTCKFCKERFDRDKEPTVKISERRYAHKACAEKQEALKTQDEKDLEELENYIKELLKINTISAKIRKQIHTFHKDYNYSYSGMKKTLHWFFEIKGNPIEKANGGIGIVPYVYDEACQYYYALYLAQLVNQEKNIEEYKPTERIISIFSPRTYIKKRKLFNFDEEEN